MGYVKLAQLIQEATQVGTAITDEEAKANMAMFQARQELANQLSALQQLPVGEGVGQYTAANCSALLKQVNDGFQLLADPAAQIEDLKALAPAFETGLQHLLPLINLPLASEQGAEHWYQFVSSQSNNLYLTANIKTHKVSGQPNQNYARSMWKLVKRSDNQGYDLVNRADGSFLNPSVAWNSAIHTTAQAPARGWDFTYSAYTGTFIIHSGQTELFQTINAMGEVLNYSEKKDGLDRNTAGCIYSVCVAGEVTDEPSADPLVTLGEIKLDGKSPYAIPATDAEKILKAESGTLFIEFTQPTAQEAPQCLIGSSCSQSSKYFSVVTRQKNKYGLEYTLNKGTAGWFTKEAKYAGQKFKMVITFDAKRGAYQYYVDGKKTNDLVVKDNNEWGYRIFGNYEGVDGLYLGGLKMKGKDNSHPFTGTIHQVKFWNRVLSAEESQELFVEQIPPVEIEVISPTQIVDGKFAADTKWYTLQIANNESVIANPGQADFIALDRSETNLEAKDLWCFVGDNEKGYTLYNKEAGTSKVLAAPADLSADAGGKAFAILKEKAQLGNYRSSWQLAPSTDLEGKEGFYIYVAGKPSEKLNNRNGKLAFWTGGADHGSTFQILFAEQTLPLNLNTGKLVRDNGQLGQNFNKYWKSNTSPQITLDASHNNMTTAKGSKDIAAYVGMTNPETYSVYSEEGYAVSHIEFDFINYDKYQGKITITSGENSVVSSATEERHFAADAAQDDDRVIFMLGGENKGIVMKNMLVTYRRAKVAALEPGFEMFCTPNSSAIPYRIPAIATAQNGNIVAVADYRFSRADIGMAHNGRIDLRYRISKDHGQTWGDILTLVEGKGAESKDFMHVGFGDPCIVGDSDSPRMLVMSCAGNVSFPNGQRYNHQCIARFYSEDNGETWSEPEDIAESIYSQFDHSSFGPARAMFIGSGKISQSKYIKVGAYKRLYCAVLLKNEAGTNTNFVLYSDDFGGTWKILGGVNQCPLPDGGDEPKAEELPDGSVVLSSRTNGGRYFNIYTYTDYRKAEGKWDNAAFSGSQNKGTACLNNSTNGEIMFVPAQRVADKKQVILALQSIPFGPGRANVGIYYKALENLNNFDEPEHLAKNWEGRHQSTRKGAAYSTMTWQKDNSLGFLFEEETYCNTSGGGYTIIYKRYTLEDITEGKYTFDATVNPNEIVKDGIDDKLNIVHEGPNIGNHKPGSKDALKKAIEAYKANANLDTYTELNRFIAALEHNEVEPNQIYRLRNIGCGTGKHYMMGNSYDFVATENPRHLIETYFTFVPVEEGAKEYYLKQVNQGTMMKPFVRNDNNPGITTNEKEAGKFVVEPAQDGFCLLLNTNKKGGHVGYIHLSGSSTLVPWDANSTSSEWAIEPVENHCITAEAMGEEFWTSIYLPFDVNLPEGVTAYVVSPSEKKEVMTIKPVENVPACTAVLIKSTQQECDFIVTKGLDSLQEVNILKGSLKEERMAPNLTYVINYMPETGVGLYHPERGSNGKAIINPNTAFYTVENETGIEAYSLELFSTAIRQIETENIDSVVIYDLNGRRVMQPKHGLYIRNGKKVYIR